MLQYILGNFITRGKLTIISPDGSQNHFGNALETSSPDIQVRLHRIFTPVKLALNPYAYLGEAYMDGTLVIEQGTLWDFLDLCGRNLSNLPKMRRGPLIRAAQACLRRIQQYNSQRASQRNVAHHYDLSDTLYRQFLDEDMQYSCAYFPNFGISLDEAQCAKKRHIAAKLLLEPGQHVLDIGCGWGGLALSLAKTAKVRVTGITLSKEQLKIARDSVHKAGLEHLVTFELRDYRDINGKFDRIVSVGMFEHVGTPHYQKFFDTVGRLLTDDGVALIHSIGQNDGPGISNPWIRKYIFPGGYAPALSEVLPVIERAGLWLTDVEILRMHYAETLRLWRERFLQRWSLVSEIYDDRFCRMWEFYLAACEMAFRYGPLMVFQAQIARRVDAVPFTRDYMFERERQKEKAYA